MKEKRKTKIEAQNRVRTEATAPEELSDPNTCHRSAGQCGSGG